MSNQEPSMGDYFARIMAIRREFEDIPGVWHNPFLMTEWKARVDAVVQEYCDALDNSRRGTIKKLVHAELVID